ncbi:MAG: hypothetical protein JW861_12540 [Bacteroidales bacterium]|nr:hypothetical protein [Bacteroidales bacterium]
MKKAFWLIVLALPLIGHSQEEKKFGIQFKGFVKTDLLYDSRQTMAIREGHFLLYPLGEIPDKENNDINAKSNFNMLSIQTRLQGLISGPDALGAKTSGLIEGEFFGHSDADINGFRLRHAFVKLEWQKTHLMVGQFWHPMFATNCFPDVVSFNTGAPFQPFSRNPQVRLTQIFGNFRMMATALTQRDFVSNGPKSSSSMYLRNSALPAVNLRLEYGFKNQEKGTDFVIGASGNYKILTPQLITGKGYKTDETIGSMAFSGYIKYSTKKFAVKLGEYWGEDSHDLTMLGGYAVKEVIDTARGCVNYTPISNTATWIDLQTNGEKWKFGLFAGYTANYGANDSIGGAVYARGFDKTNLHYIDYIYRIAPRVVYQTGKFRIAPEIEYTAAAYATTDKDTGMLNVDVKGVVTDSKEVANIRFLLGLYYFF